MAKAEVLRVLPGGRAIFMEGFYRNLHLRPGPRGPTSPLDHSPGQRPSPRRVDVRLIRFIPARGLVSGERLPLKGVLRGEVAWGDGLEGEGAGPPIVWAGYGWWMGL